MNTTISMPRRPLGQHTTIAGFSAPQLAALPRRRITLDHAARSTERPTFGVFGSNFRVMVRQVPGNITIAKKDHPSNCQNPCQRPLKSCGGVYVQEALEHMHIPMPKSESFCSSSTP